MMSAASSCLFSTFFLLLLASSPLGAVSNNNQRGELFSSSGGGGGWMQQQQQQQPFGGAGQVASNGLFLQFPQGLAPDGSMHKTDVGCEGDNMTLSCLEDGGDGGDDSRRIEVVRGNFGRFSIAVCNKHGRPDWSVNCFAPETTNVLKDRCDGLKRCVVPISSEFLPDACPETRKYLEVHYVCRSTKGGGRKKAGKNRNRMLKNLGWKKPVLVDQGHHDEVTTDKVRVKPTPPAPRKPIRVTDPPKKKTTEDPWKDRVPITTQQSPGEKTSSLLPSTGRGMRKGDGDDAASSSATVSTARRNKVSETITMRIEEHHDLLSGNGDVLVPTPSVNVAKPSFPSSSSSVAHCPGTTSRRLQWDWTPAGRTSEQPCPIGATGFARWKCEMAEGDNVARWAGAQPDMSNCKLVAMTQLEAQVRKEDPDNVVASSLAYLTGTKRLFGGDLEAAVATLRTVASRVRFRLQQSAKAGPTFPNKEAHIRQIMQNVFRSANNLLEKENEQAWLDLSVSSRLRIATQLSVALEENAFQLASVINDPDVILDSSEVLTMSISVLDMHMDPTADAVFPDQRSGNLLFVDDAALIDSEDMNVNAKGDFSEAVFISYSGMHKILDDAEIQLPKRSSSTSEEKNTKYRLNSKVVSASLGGLVGRHQELLKPVELRLRQLDSNLTDPVCVYWDLESLTWSGQGCRTISANTTDVVCRCGHLAAFAVAARPAPAGQVGQEVLGGILDRLDIVGSVVAAFLVFILILILLKCRHKLQSNYHGDSCCCCFGRSNDIRKSQSFYTGLHQGQIVQQGGQVSAAPAVGTCKLSRSMMGEDAAANSMRTQSQYVLSTQQLPQQQQLNKNSLCVGAGRSLTARQHFGNASGVAHLSGRRPHITLNPYSSQLVDSLNMMMPGGGSGNNNNSSASTKSSSLSSSAEEGGGRANDHRSATMSPQLLSLTKTLKRQQQLEQDDQVYRAVSPHGHVYWEIDPATANYVLQGGADANVASALTASAVADLDERYSRQLLQQERMPLLVQQQQQQQHLQHEESPLLQQVSQSAEVTSPAFIRNGAGRYNRSYHRGGTADRRQQQQQQQPGVVEQVQQQVQIRDCRPIQVSVKSSEYIEAKIRTLRKGGGPNEDQ